MTVSKTFALYFCIGTIYAACILFQMHKTSKKLEETEIEDEKDYRKRMDLIHHWEDAEQILKKPQNVIVALFIFMALLWPYVLYLDIRSCFRKDDEE